MAKPDPLLSADEIARRLAAILASDLIDRQARRTPGIATIAKRAGLARMAVYRFAYGQKPAEKARRKLSAALQTIKQDVI